MPRLARKIKRRVARFNELTTDLRQQLASGDGFVLSPCRTAEELRVAWRRHKKPIMADWHVRRPAFAAMPFAWWLCDHGRERPIVRSQGEEQDAAMRRLCERFGYLHASILVGTNLDQWGPWQQPEIEYLSENGLLEMLEAEYAPTYTSRDTHPCGEVFGTPW